MSAGIELAERIKEYLKQIYPDSATKTQIFSKVGVRGCTCDTWLRTLVVRRNIEVSGKKGRYNLYRYKKSS